jgi:hypothetical protein
MKCPNKKWLFTLPGLVLSFRLFGGFAHADERPYFVTYDHRLEEPGALELAYNPLLGAPKDASTFYGGLFEMGYGFTGWWTSEIYLAHQYTFGDQGAFTGFRWENRFRPLQREYWINPVIYLEYSHSNEADRSFREVVGHSKLGELEEPVGELKHEWENELELKLILSSDYKGWNISENFIAEKNLANKPWEFGYAVGASRPLRLTASPDPCRFCRENFRVGAELYGGLGDRYRFGLEETAHYFAPVVSWRFANSASLRFSPTAGLSDHSIPFMFRFGILYEIGNLGRK